ncbi:hypothetical protein OGAPHI_004284 [Ogataea philodendri]|uniref:Uncharacterized protein n=1 Tax=Ogataea philodendri TaxID=1378263 RepID=A0A9P8T5G8_9ASCO|nr:uncharacterized protein OGAPHI_004284 [Ogataea philodendri]KAH3666095.1 hypothetical protein OGAPHI_004284 [Ogataea philodendri]
MIAETNWMILPVAGVVFGAVLLIAQQLIQSLYKSKPAAAPKGASTQKTNKFHSDMNAPPPEPTPLYITPDQVRGRDDRPWRPFRLPYHQTMSIFKLDINHWLDMDKYYIHYLEEKKRIFHTYKEEHIGWTPKSREAVYELLDTVKNHMLKRYPLLFTTEDNGVHVKVELTGEVLDFSEPIKEHPLVLVSKMAKEDFYIVEKCDDGEFRLTAAAVPFPGGSFGVGEKIGKTVDAIHDVVPYYAEKLRTSMLRFFDKMAPADPVERASFYISWDHKLFLNNIYAMKEGDKVDSSILPTEFNVRVERQTLRRLPKSKAIVFTNHPIFYSIEEMKDEPLIPSLLRKILDEAPDKVMKYKNFDCFREHLVPYLDGLIQRQVDLGLIDEDTPVRTLPSYPFAEFRKDYDEKSGWTNPKNPVNYSSTLKDEILSGIPLERATLGEPSATAARAARAQNATKA